MPVTALTRKDQEINSTSGIPGKKTSQGSGTEPVYKRRGIEIRQARLEKKQQREEGVKLQSLGNDMAQGFPLPWGKLAGQAELDG